MKMINAKEGQKIAQPLMKDLRVPVPLPPGMTWEDVQAAIARHHEPICRSFRSGDGVRLQRIDSDVAEDVMLQMMERGVLALPVHDSFIVDYRHADVLREVMLSASRERIGSVISIKRDPSLIDGLQTVSKEGVDALMAELAGVSVYEGYCKRRDAFQNHKPLS